MNKSYASEQDDAHAMMKKYSHKKTGRENHLNIKNYQRNSNLAPSILNEIRARKNSKNKKLAGAYNPVQPSFVSLKPLNSKKLLAPKRAINFNPQRHEMSDANAATDIDIDAFNIEGGTIKRLGKKPRLQSAKNRMFAQKFAGNDAETLTNNMFSDDDGESNKLIQYYRQKFAKK